MKKRIKKKNNKKCISIKENKEYARAKHEVMLLKKEWEKELDEKNDGIMYDYMCACLDSALEAYKLIAKQGHSGSSISYTMHFLELLTFRKPLTAIKDKPEEWAKVDYPEEVCAKLGYKEKYQSVRCGSLFKDVNFNGETTYHDNDRVFCFDPIFENSYSFGLASKIYDEMFPIKMPYKPKSESDRFVVFCFLSDPKLKDKSDFDTALLLYIEKTNGEKIEVNRFFREPIEDEESTYGSWVEIDILEVKERIDSCEMKNLDLIDLGLDDAYHMALETLEWE